MGRTNRFPKEADFHGDKRSNETRASTADPRGVALSRGSRRGSAALFHWSRAHGEPQCALCRRARSLLVRQRTMLANALRAHRAELGLVANPGIANLAKLAQKTKALSMDQIRR